MCFGPTKAEKEAKREDITDALSARVARKGMRGGGKGRRSLYSGNTGAGFLSRFR